MTILTLFILSFTGLSFFWSRFAARKLVFEFSADQTQLFPDDTVALRVRIHNHKILPVWLTLSPVFEHTFFENQTRNNRTICLLWFQQIEFTYHLTALKRGVFTINNPDMTAGDPFRFYPRQIKSQQGLEIMVFPRLIPIRPIPVPEQHFFGLPGSASPVQDPVYILGTREYQHSTPARMIHWKAGARLDKLREKVCEPSVQGKTMILLDVSGFSDGKTAPGFEQLLETAAALAFYYQNNGHRIGVLTNAVIKGSDHSMVHTDSGPQAIPRILELLSRIQPNTGEKTMADLFARHAASFWGVSAVLCCCNANDKSAAAAAQLCRQKRIPLKVVQSQPLENEEKAVFDISNRIIDMETICL